MDTAWEPSRPSSSGSEARRRSSRLQTPISTGESTQNIDQNVLLDKMQNIAGQARRSGRKRQSEAVSTGDPTEEVMQPLTDEERRQWKGWVELESDPAHFNFILRQYGVKDVKIQEVLGLNDDLLSLLPKPTYGLIFLFKYRDDDAESGDQTSVSPNNIWFANQTSNNACATVALLNIVMNVPEVNLGYALGEFKEATQALKPACRGYRLGYDDFVRDIHNSFARKMDMRNSDLALSNDKTAWKKAQAAKRRKTPARKGGKRKKTKDEDESGFHFIAYVPVNGEVWRLDGLQKEPVNLGQHQEDWMAVARVNIDARIGQYDDDGLQFNLLALCKSPLKTIPERLAETIRSILAVEEILNSVFPDWRSFSPNDDRASLDRPDEACDLSQDLLDQAQLSDLTLKRLEIVRSDPTGLLDLHGEWMKLQNELRMSYIQEVAMIGQENEKAARQQVDYTPLIYASIKTLAEEGILREIVKDVQAYED